jgi:hypothetical protein
VAAKALAYRLAPEAALVRLVQHYGTPFFEQDVFGDVWAPIGFVIYLVLSLVGSLGAVRRDSRAWPLALFPWLYLAAYAAANPLIFRWYLAPPLPFYLVFILTGLAKLLSDLAHAARGTRPEQASTRGVAIAGAAMLLLSLNQWTWRPDHGPSRPAPEMAWHALELYYARVGQALAPSAGAQTVVAAGDVGALGYYSDARILDTVGLISPEATAYYPIDPALYVITYAIPPRLILDAQPDYVVLLEVYGREGLLRDAGFLAEYALAERIDTDIYGSDGLLVYRRAVP